MILKVFLLSNSSNGWCATCDPNAQKWQPGYCGPEMATVRIRSYCLKNSTSIAC